MAAIALVLSPVRAYMLSVAELIATVIEAGLCAEIAILTITCVYLYVNRQSTIVVLAFLLIALDRRAQDVLRQRAAGSSSAESRDKGAGR